MINNANRVEYSNTSADIWRYITFILAVIVLFFSISCIVGYIGFIESLIRYTPNSRAIPYVAIACFLCSGLAILATIVNARLVAMSFGVLVFAISIISGLFGTIDYQIDHQQLKTTILHLTARQQAYYMPMNSAICFVLSALIILNANCRKSEPRCIVICTWLSMILLTLSIIFSLGFLFNFSVVDDWDNQLPMSTPTAVGLIFLSTALLSLSIHRSIVARVRVMPHLPYIGSACVLLTSVILAVEIAELYDMNSSEITIFPIVTLFLGMFISLSIGALWYITRVAIAQKNHALSSKSILHAILDTTLDGIVVYNLEGDILIYNQRFANMWHLHDEQLQNLKQHQVLDEMLHLVIDKDKFYIASKTQQKNPVDKNLFEVELRNGTILEIMSQPYHLNEKLIGNVYFYKDITIQRQLEQQLTHKATYDDLTNLPNRFGLREILLQMISNSKGSLVSTGVFLVDIKKFSAVNDALGRNKSDLLLQMVAANLKDSLPVDCILGRFSVDVFLIISEKYNNKKNCSELIEIINKVFERNYDIGNREIKLFCNIGAAFYPKDGQDVDILLANTDAALLRAKNSEEMCQYYDDKLYDLALERMEMESKLHRAIEYQQFIVYYQPIINLKTNLPIGVEALVRWKNDAGEIIQPMEFIPIAEDIGVIDKIGTIVFTEACKQVKNWEKQGLHNLKMAINVSPKQFINNKFTNHVYKTMHEYNINPAHLELELTETSLISASNLVEIFLKDLNKIGIQTVIDDFGAGYSSFNYVKRFKISKVKIDKTFIDGLYKGSSEKAIVKAMIAMAHSLGYIILAEGVETQEQYNILQELECDEFQGYLYAMPMPAAECTAYLKDKLK